MCFGHRGRHIDQWNQIDCSDGDPCVCDQLIPDKGDLWGKTNPPANGDETIGYPYGCKNLQLLKIVNGL